jgi:hypothetical protein
MKGTEFHELSQLLGGNLFAKRLVDKILCFSKLPIRKSAPEFIRICGASVYFSARQAQII